MLIEEQLSFKKLNFLKSQNKETKEKILKENNYDIKIAEEIELEILKTLSKFEKKVGEK